MQRYNTAVVTTRTKSDPNRQPQHQRHPIYATETAGLLLIAFLVLVITVARYWHAIHWSMR
jgi:hypothetical protein